jgi:hypothetical protein
MADLLQKSQYGGELLLTPMVSSEMENVADYRERGMRGEVAL